MEENIILKTIKYVAIDLMWFRVTTVPTETQCIDTLRCIATHDARVVLDIGTSWKARIRHCKITFVNPIIQTAGNTNIIKYCIENTVYH